jgi:CRISPR-associated protein Csx17
MNPIPLPGCRHDILGHNLKATGILRALASCADPEYCDPEAEGWWDLEDAQFYLCSPKYPHEEGIVKFFTEHYQPTGILAAWNKDIGLDEAFAKKIGRALDWKNANLLSSSLAAKTITGEQAFSQYREAAQDSISSALDALSSPFVKRDHDNPIFLAKGIAGRAHVLRTFWSCVEGFLTHKQKANLAEDALFGGWSFGTTRKGQPTGKGAPFFPDAIKTYNNGLGWVTKNFPFNALDYVLAVEGALAFRGAVSRTLGVSSRRFAAFPFVFDTGEDKVSYTGESKGIAIAFWTPLWSHATTYRELESFICDAQARLPRKEARFSSEFARAQCSQGVDAGFAGWQEFRFKMRASDVPWSCTGRFWKSTANSVVEITSTALSPIDESGFLEQFEPTYKGNKIDSRSPHQIRAVLNRIIENGIAEPTPENCIQILVDLYNSCRELAISKALRDTIGGQRVVFFRALPQEPWQTILEGLQVVPEFRIARALASIVGLTEQSTRKFSFVQPFLGSLLPLKCGPSGWYLPTQANDLSKQAVWSGDNLSSDLARVFSRRYLDSLYDDRPALRSCYAAPLQDILAFLNGELDDHRIARWTEALSLIDWQLKKDSGHENAGPRTEIAGASPDDNNHKPIPIAYAALRSLLEVECERQGTDLSAWKKRRSQRPIVLLCQQSAPSLALAVEDALHWLSIWGVKNYWAGTGSQEPKRLAGRAIICVDHKSLRFRDQQFFRRIAAAVAVPLEWRDHGELFRSVTLPQT